MTEPLSKRRLRFAELRNAQGEPLDPRALASQGFLTSNPTDRRALAKKVAKSRLDANDDDQTEYRETLAQCCLDCSRLMAELRPHLTKASQRTASAAREKELMDAAKRLRAMNAQK